MTDLKALQYPRHVHKGGTWKIVSSPDDCDAAMDAGWVLSPGDAPRATHDAALEVDTPIDATTDGDAPEASAPVSDAPAPKKRGRPKKG